MNSKWFIYSAMLLLLFSLHSCKEDHDELKADIGQLKEQVQNLEQWANDMVRSIEGLHNIVQGDKIVGVTNDEVGYTIELSNGKSYFFAEAKSVKGLIPQIGIDSDGDWVSSIDDGQHFSKLLNDSDSPISAHPMEGITPCLRISNEAFWQVSYDNGVSYQDLLHEGERTPAFIGNNQNSIFSEVNYDKDSKELSLALTNGDQFKFPVIDSFYLQVLDMDEEVQHFSRGSSRSFAVEQCNVAEAMIVAPEGWLVKLSEDKLTITSPTDGVMGQLEYVKLIITSAEKYIRMVSVPVQLSSMYSDACTTWLDFESASDANILLDYSYAGYMHGEIAPPNVETLGYKVYDITDYGAVPNDGKSDKEALIKVLEAMGATRGKDKDAIRYQKSTGAKAIIYFPEGEFILQADGEQNQTLRLTMGDLVIKGAGKDKTFIKMEVKNEPRNPNEMWSAPVMLELKHNSGLQPLTTVTADASKGSFSVQVASVLGIAPGDWVCLHLENNDPALVHKELKPWAPTSLMTNILNKGVQVQDYHQVKSISGNRITFVEPIMHEVEHQFGWRIMKYPHYENVGIEDITFVGDAKPDFAHHASADDDGAYKIIDFVRLTNSWMRRVNFVSVSEASSIVSCANVSVYDVEISGNRGHSAIRSQASSRIFIGKVTDKSDGYEAITSNGQIGSQLIKGAGQYHACGVSKQSMGAVIWNVEWGVDGCFESHATQPRATLIDHCRGAFIPWREGGDAVQLPNHLDDLVIWNMEASVVKYDNSWNGKFVWWDAKNRWWKNLPPVVVGFHGQPIVFDESPNQLKRLESNGAKVEPASLYEAQLKKRLGYVPAWLQALK